MKLEAAQRIADETLYTLQLDEDQIRDLAHGVVPAVVKALAYTCLDWADSDRRNAERPEPKRRRKSA